MTPLKTKRCTNSACRRVFRVEQAACPYCEKKYPALASAVERSRRYAVILRRVPADAMLEVIGELSFRSGLPHRQIIEVVGQTPSLVGARYSQYHADIIRHTIRKAGGEAEVLPANRRMKGIFVPPGKGG